MSSPDQVKNFSNPDNGASGDKMAPGSDIKKYLEEAWSFYFHQNEQKGTHDSAREVADFEVLLRYINAHIERGENWKDDMDLVGSVERFIRERFEKKIKESASKGQQPGVAYYEDRLKVLLEDLHRKE